MSGTTATELVAANPENVTPTAARRILTLGMLAALVYTVGTGAILIASWYAADHHFVYPLDDAYIGMAIAKNLALHGVWGVSRYGFTSADSSLLFPLLMAAVYRIAGVNEVAPLAISWLAAVAVHLCRGANAAGISEPGGAGDRPDPLRDSDAAVRGGRPRHGTFGTSAVHIDIPSGLSGSPLRNSPLGTEAGCGHRADGGFTL